jgi:regulator of sigma E protease
MKAFGVWPAQRLTIAKVSDVNALYERTGLLPGDRIKAVNGKDVQRHWELTEIVGDTLVSEVRLSAERTDEAGRLKVVESRRIRLELISTGTGHIYSMVPRLQLEQVEVQKSFWIKVAAKMRQVLEMIGILQKLKAKPFLQSGDIILAIGEKDSPTYEEFGEVIQEYEKEELPIKVLRVDANGIEENLTVTVVPKRSKDDKRVVIGISLIPAFDTEHPVVAKTVDVEGGPTKLEIPHGAAITAVGGVGVSNFSDIIREIGRHADERVAIDWRIDEETVGSVTLDVGAAGEFVTVKFTFAEYIPFERLEPLYKASGPIDAIAMGYRKTVMFIAQTYVTLRRLVGGLVSPKELMGPVGIIRISYSIVAEQPLVYYVYFLGLISACIAVFNFLPLPPLDGGLVVILLVEKIKGSALSERTQGIVAYAGWVLIGGFFLYVTFNDIVRSFF